jgi:hypothetical protein
MGHPNTANSVSGMAMWCERWNAWFIPGVLDEARPC